VRNSNLEGQKRRDGRNIQERRKRSREKTPSQHDTDKERIFGGGGKDPIARRKKGVQDQVVRPGDLNPKQWEEGMSRRRTRSQGPGWEKERSARRRILPTKRKKGKQNF